MGIESSRRYEVGHEKIEDPEKPKLENYLERGFESFCELNKLETIELQHFLEQAEAKVIEVEPGPIKNKYRCLVQAIKNTLSDRGSSFNRDYFQSTIRISDEYNVIIDNDKMPLKTRVGGEAHNFYKLTNIGLQTTEINNQQSNSLEIYITEEKLQCWINLRLFRVVQKKETTEKKYLYIADRYVIEKLRGNKIGEQLLKIADEIARTNNCELIFANLIPEYPEDKKKLEKGHEKAGYEVIEENKKVLAIKKLKEKN